MQIDKCFGFDTAVEEAQRALLAAKVEAVSGYKGLGVVKLMGRSSGFIAMQASMASGEHTYNVLRRWHACHFVQPMTGLAGDVCRVRCRW